MRRLLGGLFEAGLMSVASPWPQSATSYRPRPFCTGLWNELTAAELDAGSPDNLVIILTRAEEPGYLWSLNSLFLRRLVLELGGCPAKLA